jgi:hypothetical protein
MPTGLYIKGHILTAAAVFPCGALESQGTHNIPRASILAHSAVKLITP